MLHFDSAGQEEESDFSLSELFHEGSKAFWPVDPLSGDFPSGLTQEELNRHLLSLGKDYPATHKIALPDSSPRISDPYWKVASSRRSTRSFSGAPVSLEEMAGLLHYASGVTGSLDLLFDGKRYKYPLRVTPAAGGICAVEIYLAALSVSSLKPGIYHYNPIKHNLSLIRTGQFRKALWESYLRYDFIKKASALILLTGVFHRKKYKYGERGYRFVLLDAGHLGQSFYLAAAALNLGVVGIGGFLDDEMNQLLEIDGVHEALVYSLAIGKESKGA